MRLVPRRRRRGRPARRPGPGPRAGSRTRVDQRADAREPLARPRPRRHVGVRHRVGHREHAGWAPTNRPGHGGHRLQVREGLLVHARRRGSRPPSWSRRRWAGVPSMRAQQVGRLVHVDGEEPRVVHLVAAQQAPAAGRDRGQRHLLGQRLAGPTGQPAGIRARRRSGGAARAARSGAPPSSRRRTRGRRGARSRWRSTSGRWV